MATPASIATGQVTLTASAPVLIVAARPTRAELVIQFNSGSGSPPLAVGNADVTAETGFLIYPRTDTAGNLQGYFILETGAALYGIATGVDITVSFVETFD